MAQPVTAGEFAGLMAAVGPFGVANRVAVAVSGGADSMALAVLLARWGQPTAFIVDHGLRPASAQEARTTADRLSAAGIASRVLPSLTMASGPAVSERARAARYAALESACRSSGHADLVLGHHAQDQAETVLLRQQSGSGPAGLAGMAAVAYGDVVRLLRPLLPVSPERLRATLIDCGVPWIEDPTNHDLATPRARMRAAFRDGGRPTVTELRRDARRHGLIRQQTEAAIADELARHAAFLPGGVALVTAPALSPAALSALIWTMSGARYPPATASVARLAGQLRPATVHGAALLRSRDGWMIGREAAAMAPSRPAEPGVEWDGRFRLGGAVPEGCTIGPLGDDTAKLRTWSALPAALLRTVPAIRRDGVLFTVPHLSYPDGSTCGGVPIWPSPSRPVASAPFSVA